MTAGWSLAQAVACIVQHRCGITINVDEDTSLALLFDFDETGDLPPGAVADAQGKLLAALAEGRLTATAIRSPDGEPVTIPTENWQRLQIRLDLNGDTVMAGKLNYSEVRLLPLEVTNVWPPRVPGHRHRLQIVGGTPAAPENTESKTYPIFAPRAAAPPTRGIEPTDINLTPGEQDVDAAVEALQKAGQLPKQPRNRNQAIRRFVEDGGGAAPSVRLIQEYFKKKPLQQDV